MKLRGTILLAILLPLRIYATEPDVGAKITTVVINPAEVTQLHLRMGFISTIRMPEEISSIALGNRDAFAADHSPNEPLYVYVRPLTSAPAESNLVIATKSGQHVTLELISDGAGNSVQPVDFLLVYRVSRGFMIPPDTGTDPEAPGARLSPVSLPASVGAQAHLSHDLAQPPMTALDAEYALQKKINAPDWTQWKGQQIETSIGDIRAWNNEMMLSYSIFNHSNKPVEIVPPQIQITGRKLKRKKKEGKEIIADQLEIRDYRLSTTRIEPGERADGAVVFNRPNFKQSAEKLVLQIAQANQVDHPILIPLPFTPPAAGRKDP